MAYRIVFFAFRDKIHGIIIVNTELTMGAKRFYLLLFSLSLFFSGLGVFVVNAVSDLGGESDVRARFYEHPNGLGAGGYDVVAYFDDRRAVVGDKKYEAMIGGATWRFSSAERRDLFVADPSRYLPRYGGHCAYAVANGYLAPGDPTAWSIRDGALYFNYNKSVRNAWLANAAEFVRLAENNWPQLNN